MSDARRYDGKVALVTGAGSGIGRSVALRLADEGASVFAVDVNEAGLKQTQADASAPIAVRTGDLGDPDVCADVVGGTVGEFGRLDVLGNIAGIYLAGNTTEFTRDQYRKIMAVNLDACFFLAQAAIPHLLEADGNIVNIASNAGLQGVPYSAAYCMSKGGVVQLTRSLAVEFLTKPLRVNAIAPAGTNTNIAANAAFPADMEEAHMVRMAGMRGMAEPGDVASLFAFLGSDEAKAITGAIYTIDNGLTAS